MTQLNTKFHKMWQGRSSGIVVVVETVHSDTITFTFIATGNSCNLPISVFMDRFTKI
jgi:hypothetical protein